MATVGVVGGGGWLAGALLRPALAGGIVRPERLILSSRSGDVSGFDVWPRVRMTTDNAELVAESDVVMLCVRPHDLADITLDLTDKLLVSVVAGVTAEALARNFGARRIVRAMPNACAEQRLSFTPWFATDNVPDHELDFVFRFFSASGRAHGITDETQLDYFTALTGSGPAFPALFADAMIRHAIGAGIDPDVADAAVRQLFLGAGVLMAQSETTPAGLVDVFLEYQGTTAAGLTAMIESDVAAPIFKGLSAARRRVAKGSSSS
ncbi:NAD(P)-binding domain-containing protein [Rhizobium sp. ARZ01]|uniref:pyrroline-5-carboxylate reductase family protein n=1 Tax=Rhizobium sp. ARZ01 TaxID=2769313 RepID=UPI001780F472|nr:pyrroline-5-carboxylate reductase dimerization domain-containing protein [Rhizobium sp. ARZ01]MBD9374377.1 NAD(P)-binding domain-containing protein [Rhizobium sp. ARZ01]